MSTVSRRMILTVLAVSTLPLLGLALLRITLQIQIPDMTRDAAAIAKIHPLYGLLSTLGILMWWSSATVWFFAAWLRRAQQGVESIGFFVSSGILSAYLALDDLFQIHEYLATTYLKLPEAAVYGLLGIAIAIYLLRYRQRLQRPDGALLLRALTLLSTSVVVDTVLEQCKRAANPS